MKCRYYFSANSTLTSTAANVLRNTDFEYEFIQNNTLIVGITVTTKIEPSEWPEITTDQQGKLSHLDPKTPRLLEIETSLRVIEGILSVYGSISIDFEHPNIEWIPENEDERKVLQLSSITIDHEKSDQTASISAESLSSIIQYSGNFIDLEVPLTFYRRGKRSFWGRRYIECVYEFYFFLESLYANGKTKNYHVEEEFKKSDELRLAIQKVLPKVKLPQGEPDVQSRFDAIYRNTVSEEVIKHFVSLRGQLHHYTQHGSKTWHPERSLRYKADAYALAAISTEIAANRCFKNTGISLKPDEKITLRPNRAKVKVRLSNIKALDPQTPSIS